MRIALVIALAAVVFPVWPQEAQPPRPLPGNPQPLYPGEADQQGVEGDVNFRAKVGPEGQVTDVVILDVPREGLGFEDAVRQALLQWRFEPSTAAWDYTSHAEFYRQLSYHHARMYTKSSAEVLPRLLDLLGELDLSPKKSQFDRNAGALITPWITFSRRSKSLPPPPWPETIGAREFRLHIFVPQFAEPARVYVDAIVKGGPGRALRYYFRNADLPEWLFSMLEKRLEEPGTPVPKDHVRRSTLAKRLLREPIKLDPASDPVAPSRIEAVCEKPFYPEHERKKRNVGTFVFKAVISPDGCVEDVTLLSPPDADSEFVTSAREILTLWRYYPARMKGEPVTVYFTIPVIYRLQ